MQQNHRTGSVNHHIACSNSNLVDPNTGGSKESETKQKPSRRKQSMLLSSRNTLIVDLERWDWDCQVLVYFAVVQQLESSLKLRLMSSGMYTASTQRCRLCTTNSLSGDDSFSHLPAN